MDFFSITLKITPSVYHNGIDLIFSIFILFFIILLIIEFAKFIAGVFSPQDIIQISEWMTAWEFIQFIGFAVLIYFTIKSIPNQIEAQNIDSVVNSLGLPFTYFGIALMIVFNIYNGRKAKQSEQRILKVINDKVKK